VIDSISHEKITILAQSIDSIVVANLKPMIIGKSLIISEETMNVLCQALGINYESFMRSVLPTTHQDSLNPYNAEVKLT